jgi:hypothetical protein
MAQDLSTISKQPASITISRRLYNLFTFSMVTVSFIITWLEYQFVSEGRLATVFARMNPCSVKTPPINSAVCSNP